MSDNISNRYIKAILASFSSKDLGELLGALCEINLAFRNNKFKEIINSPMLNSEKKAEFIISAIKNPSKKCVNLIKILAQNNRLMIIPTLTQRLNYANSRQKNQFEGVIYSKFNISSQQKKALEESFSNKFNAKIVLENCQNDFNGIKINIENLGVEINFSIDRLRNLLSEHILKAI